MVQAKILEVVEIIEDMTAHRIGDGVSCDILCEGVIAASGMDAKKFNFD